MSQKNLLSKDFLLVALGQIISIFGNQILRYALPLYLLVETGSAALFGSILACAFIPMLLIYPVGGVIADRFNKRSIMVILDFVTALLVVSFCLALGRVSIVPLTAAMMMALYAIQGAYQPAVQASIPVLVSPAHLLRANAVINMITSVSGMAGPVLGGILLSVFGLKPILFVSACCFLAASVMELFIHSPHEKQCAAGSVAATVRADLKDSLHFLFCRQPLLWQMSAVYASSVLLLTTLMLIAIPVIITGHLGFPPDTANRLYGYAQGVIAFGALLGGVFSGVFSQRLRAKASPFLLLGCACSILFAGTALHLMCSPAAVYLTLLICCALLLALSTVFQIQILSCIQILTPKPLIGKVLSCVICLCMCANPIGQFAYGLVFELLEGRLLHLPFYAAGGLMLCIALPAYRLFHRIDGFMDASGQTEAAAQQ